MSEGPGFLEFFILEASEYVEQLDGLLLGSGSGGPDPDALQRVSRALRGTATMAKLPAFSELAAAIERVGRSLHDASLPWDQNLRAVLIAAIDDLKVLLHGARNWSANEDRRARARTAELTRYAPPRATSATQSASAGSPYLSTEAANIAAGLELLTTRASDVDTASNVLRRIRALRGVAGVKEIAPLADALEATESAGRALESGSELTPEARRLLETAAAYLRALATALRTGGDPNASTPTRDAFEQAHDTWTASDAERERVVPIETLFYQDTTGVLEAAQHPPTTASERFRLELVSLGEHLRQIVSAARTTSDPASRVRVQRDLKRALRALEASAESFGERDVAEFVRGHTDAANTLDFLGISALDDLASVMAEPGAQGQRLRARLAEVSGGRNISDAIGMGFSRQTPLSNTVVQPAAPVPRRPTPVAVPAVAAPVQPAAQPAQPVAPPSPPPAPVAPPRPRPVTPAAADASALDPRAASLIDTSIAALESFTSEPIMTPAQLPELTGEIVPIETLLYRGRAALDRAVEVRDEIQRGGSVPDPDALEELFDLIELARTG
jgi:chemotaxis protein histidine kinase CheA